MLFGLFDIDWLPKLLFKTLVWALFLALFLNVIANLSEGRSYRRFTWSWDTAVWALVLGMFSIACAELITWLVNLPIGRISNWKISELSIGIALLILVLAKVFSTGIKTSDIKTKTVPNQGIWRSATSASMVALLAATINVCIGFTFIFFLKIYGHGLPAILLYGLSQAVLHWLVMNCGGNACTRHFALRLILLCSGKIPWNYARFLDYCTERLFQPRIGGRYRFIHKLLQDHFAKILL